MTTGSAIADASLDVVELDIPAHPAYVAVVRTAAAGLAARADLTLDRIEDLRIAVDEACALLLHRGSIGSVPGSSLASPAANPTTAGSGTADGAVGEAAELEELDDDATIHCLFTVEEDALTVDISGPRVPLPDPSAFAWAVLDALVDTLRTGEDVRPGEGPTTWLRLSVRSSAGSWT